MTGTYTVNTVGTEKGVDVVAEEIESLAQSLRSRTNDAAHVIQTADAIMHLAADIRFNAEKRRRATCQHERLDMDGICRACGADCRGI